MLIKNSFARGAVLGALVTSILWVIGMLGAQSDALARRDFILREHLANYASDRDMMHERLAYLETMVVEAIANTRLGFERVPESDAADIRVLIRNHEDQLTALAETVAQHAEDLRILLDQGNTTQDRR